MGECGCGTEAIEVVLPGPDGVRYGVELYPGCHYCSLGPSIGLYRVTDDEYEILSHAKEPEWAEYTDGVQFSPIPVITPEAMVASLKENADEILATDNFGTRSLFRTLQDAVWKTAVEGAS